MTTRASIWESNNVSVYLFYILACVPVVIGGLLWLFDKRVNYQEWVGSSVACFILAALFHLLAIQGQTRDVQTLSGKLSNGRHYSAWLEYYEYAVYRTEVYWTSGDKGSMEMHTRQVFDHWEPTTRRHNDEYIVQSNDLNTSYNVDKTGFGNISRAFGGISPIRGERTTMSHHSHMISGDPNDYVTTNKTGYVWPVTKLAVFQNKIKATPTTFSFAKVPANIKVFAYPENKDPFKSDRLLGNAASAIDIFTFDQMNAELGPVKKVNVIMVGLGDKDSLQSEWLQSSWVGGKKNDIVVVWGGPNDKPTWVRCFGWTDSKECLRQIETIVLENGAKTSTLPLIKAEIERSYTLKNWDKDFAYISVPAAPWAFWTYLAVMITSQIAFWTWANYANLGKIQKTSNFYKYS